MKTIKLQVWGIILTVPGHPFGSRHSQLRAFVATKSRAAAARLMEISDRELRMYGMTTGNQTELTMALAEPNTVFVRPMDSDIRPVKLEEKYKRG